MKILGIALPLERGNSGYFNQTRDPKSAIRTNLINLILTRLGERPMLPTFGCAVHRYIFEPMTPENVLAVEQSIRDALETWMPFISIVSLSVEPLPNENRVNLTLSYQIVSLRNITDTIVVQF